MGTKPSCNSVLFRPCRDLVPLVRFCLFCSKGETATLVKMEVTSCTSQPCLMNVSNTYEMSPTFIPGYSSNTTQYQLRFYYESKLYIFALISLTDSFIAGSQYKILRQIVIPSELGGKSGYFRVVLFDLSGRYHVSRCFDAMVGN
ncbi:uncharacterized protein LOC110854728 isoform X2 [Folsomia candida]|uniref:uncharacterized protein LOC110854728 isoform X2 n=1 Tax=Folsomia candida TaxID=158441 RepID=UPI000B8F088D|nr:uncharacterized protein LOC110854728 isoform X2 [Folsomia candida]